MMKNNKNALELFAISFLFISGSVVVLLLLQNNFPGGLDGITGNALASVNVSPSVNASCNTTIYPGWNLNSFFCFSTYEQIGTILNNISNESIVYTYRSSDSSDPWKVYNPDLPWWVVIDLTYMSRTEGYWIYLPLNESINFTMEGSKRIPTLISLRDGWNLVGYPTDIDENISIALNGIDSIYETIISFNNTGKYYLNYTNGIGGSLNQTKTYQGYWLYTNSSGTWVVNW